MVRGLVVAALLAQSAFGGDVECSEGYTCWKDDKEDGLVWVKLDNGKSNVARCKGICEDALIQSDKFYSCEPRKAPKSKEELKPIADGMEFNCDKGGGCWNMQAPGTGLLLVTKGYDEKKRCYFPSEEMLECETSVGNGNCYGERYSPICPCVQKELNEACVWSSSANFPRIPSFENDADPDSRRCLDRINYWRKKACEDGWVECPPQGLPPMTECTCCHECANGQSNYVTAVPGRKGHAGFTWCGERVAGAGGVRSDCGDLIDSFVAHERKVYEEDGDGIPRCKGHCGPIVKPGCQTFFWGMDRAQKFVTINWRSCNVDKCKAYCEDPKETGECFALPDPDPGLNTCACDGADQSSEMCSKDDEDEEEEEEEEVASEEQKDENVENDDNGDEESVEEDSAADVDEAVEEENEEDSGGEAETVEEEEDEEAEEEAAEEEDENPEDGQEEKSEEDANEDDSSEEEDPDEGEESAEEEEPAQDGDSEYEFEIALESNPEKDSLLPDTLVDFDGRTTYELKFMLRLDDLSNRWASIIHIGNENRIRAPAIFMHPRKRRRLHFRQRGVKGRRKNWNFGCDPGIGSTPKLNEWFQVTVTQSAELFAVRYGDKVVCSQEMRLDPPTGEQKVYFSDPWYNVAPVSVKNLTFVFTEQESEEAAAEEDDEESEYEFEIETRSNPVKNAELSNALVNFGDRNSYSLTFMLRLEELQNRWSNIIHVGNENQIRSPAIFVHPKQRRRLHFRQSGKRRGRTNWNLGCDPAIGETPELNEWFQVAVTQSEDLFEVRFNREVVCSKKMEMVASEGEQKVWFSDPWFAASLVSVKKLKFQFIE